MNASFFLICGNGVLGPAIASNTLYVERGLATGAGEVVERGFSTGGAELEATGSPEANGTVSSGKTVAVEVEELVSPASRGLEGTEGPICGKEEFWGSSVDFGDSAFVGSIMSIQALNICSVSTNI